MQMLSPRPRVQDALAALLLHVRSLNLSPGLAAEAQVKAALKARLPAAARPAR